MSWTPPARPDWVAAINAGQIVPLAEEAALPFERDALLGEARARLGLAAGRTRDDVADFCHDEFEAELFLEPLDRLLPALEDEAELSVVGRWMARRFILRILEVRLQLMATLRADPGVCDEPIEAPLFVAGAPRTGTTILHAMLAADPRGRVPEGWELLRPVPSPDPDPARSASDPRIALADRELVLPQTVVSGLLKVHAYGARKPKECLSAMSFAFRSEEFSTRYHVPSFETWLRGCDMTPAYRMHRLVLQVLQRRSGAAAWVLKSPVHLHSLQTLFDVYPDACVAITHRDPLALLASLTSLVATLRWAHSDRVDYQEIARSNVTRYRRSFDQLVDDIAERRLRNAQLHHSRYADFLGEPLDVLSALYAHFDRDFSEPTRAAAAQALAERPKAEHGNHEYRFADLGLDALAERRHFARYQEAFSVPDELRAETA